MKIDRFWLTQIAVGTVVIIVFTGIVLYTHSSVNASEQALQSLNAATVHATLGKAGCTNDGHAPSPADIDSALSSGTPNLRAKCLDFLQVESMNGDKGAELWLGRAYHNGWGVPQSLEEAIIHYSQAATASDENIRKSAEQWLSIAQQDTKS